MKIALISDLHIEQQNPLTEPLMPLIAARNPRVTTLIGFPDQLDPGVDVLIIAGDVHDDAVVRAILFDMLETQYRIPVLFVAGNHCCHFGSLNRALQVPELRLIKGVSIGLATLWTRLNVMDELKSRTFVDMTEIHGMTSARWNQLHDEHLAALVGWQPDVIVTHHAPFVQSISDGYRNHPLNNFFVNRYIDPSLFPKTKLWVHGHVHQDHDYQIDHMRIACSPKGYYFENRRASVKIIEI